MRTQLALSTSISTLRPIVAAAAIAGALATAVPVSPTLHYHPNTSTVTTTGSPARLATGTDRMALANVSGGSAGNGGPKVLTDLLGRKLWRFEGSEYLDVAAAFGSINTQNLSVFMVGRFHRARTSNPVFGLGNVALATTINTGGIPFQSGSGTNGAPTLRSGSLFATSTTTPEKSITGSQLHVSAHIGRTSGNGGSRFYVNNDVCAFAATTTVTNATSVAGAGAEIGRYPFSPGAAGTWGMFDLYELLIYSGNLTNAQADAIAAALVANWSIPAIVNQHVFDGDSITQGVGDVLSGDSIAMAATAPGGSNVFPANWRVMNMGASGNTIANMLTRRDAANTVYGYLLSGGRNTMSGQIGRNDAVAARTGAQMYTDITGLINTASLGYSQRGWEVVWCVNIGTGSALMTQINDLRSLLRNITQFRADCGGLTAQQLRICDLPLMTAGVSGTLWDTTADASDLTWFQNDNTHPSVIGTRAMATGAGADSNVNSIVTRVLAAA